MIAGLSGRSRPPLSGCRDLLLAVGRLHEAGDERAGGLAGRRDLVGLAVGLAELLELAQLAARRLRRGALRVAVLDEAADDRRGVGDRAGLGDVGVAELGGEVRDRLQLAGARGRGL